MTQGAIAVFRRVDIISSHNVAKEVLPDSGKKSVFFSVPSHN
jgi:hypothetical protein